MRPTTRLNTTPAKIFVLVGLLYFNALAPLVALLGLVDPDSVTVYYAFSGLESWITPTVLGFNALYVGVSALLLFYVVPSRMMAYEYGSLIGIIASGLAVTVLYGDAWVMNRAEIKSNSSIVTTLIMAAVLAYLGAVVMTTQSTSKLLLAISILLAAAVLSFERETVLYISIALAMYLVRKRTNWKTMFIFVSASVLIMATYKSFLITAKAEDLAQALSTDHMMYAATSLVSDNIHKFGLEASFLAGTAPTYNAHSMTIPFYVERVFDQNAATNGQLATQFYTGGEVGTGFSGILESSINFGPLGPCVMILLTVISLKGAIATRSPIILLSISLCLIKFQRGELWPAIIGFVAGACILEGCLWLKRKTTIKRSTTSSTGVREY